MRKGDPYRYIAGEYNNNGVHFDFTEPEADNRQTVDGCWAIMAVGANPTPGVNYPLGEFYVEYQIELTDIGLPGSTFGPDTLLNTVSDQMSVKDFKTLCREKRNKKKTNKVERILVLEKKMQDLIDLAQLEEDRDLQHHVPLLRKETVPDIEECHSVAKSRILRTESYEDDMLQRLSLDDVKTRESQGREKLRGRSTSRSASRE